MAVRRLNHAVLYVSDVARTIDFYENALDFRVISSFPGGAFFQAPGSTNDHDLGVFEIGREAGPSAAGRGTVGLYHLAWEVETLDDLERLAGVGVDPLAANVPPVEEQALLPQPHGRRRR